MAPAALSFFRNNTAPSPSSSAQPQPPSPQPPHSAPLQNPQPYSYYPSPSSPALPRTPTMHEKEAGGGKHRKFRSESLSTGGSPAGRGGAQEGRGGSPSPREKGFTGFTLPLTKRSRVDSLTGAGGSKGEREELSQPQPHPHHYQADEMGRRPSDKPTLSTSTATRKPSNSSERAHSFSVVSPTFADIEGEGEDSFPRFASGFVPGAGGGNSFGSHRSRMFSITEGVPVDAGVGRGLGSGAGSRFEGGLGVAGGSGSRGLGGGRTESTYYPPPSPRSADYQTSTFGDSISRDSESSFGGNRSNDPLASPRPRPPKPRGMSDSTTDKGKRRAGWFGSLGVNREGGIVFDEVIGGEAGMRGYRTGSLESGTMEAGRKESGSSGSAAGRGSFSSSLGRPSVDQSVPAGEEKASIGRSGSLSLRGLKDRLAGTNSGTSGQVGKIISGPIGPVVKASREEIMLEFDRISGGGKKESMGSLGSQQKSVGTVDPSPEQVVLVDDAAGNQFARPVTPTNRPVRPREESYERPGLMTPGTQYPTPLSPAPARKPSNGRLPLNSVNWSGKGDQPVPSPRQGRIAAPQRNGLLDTPTSITVEASRPKSPAAVAAGRTSPSPYTAEWLSQKPASRLDDAVRPQASPSGSELLARPLYDGRSSFEDNLPRTPKRKPAPLFQSSPSPALRSSRPHRTLDYSADNTPNRSTETSGAEADDDSEERLSEVDDAVIAVAERIMSPKQNSFRSPARTHFPRVQERAVASGVAEREEIQVETVCRTVSTADGEEMRWEVVIRKRLVTSEAVAGGSTSPLPLTEAKTVTTAPAAASSLNLSLAFDQPTGKLAFISLPSAAETQATPVRKRSGSLSRAKVDRSPSPSPNRSVRDSPSYESFAQSPFTTVRTGTPPSPRKKTSLKDTRRQTPKSASPTVSAFASSPMSSATFPITPTSPPTSPREVLVRQRRVASLQGGVLYTRSNDNRF